VGHPFLVDGYDSPAARFKAIIDETQQYLAARHRAANPNEDFVRPDLDALGTIPPVLLELSRVERWAELGALPLSGGWMEHPAYYIEDLEAAMIGRQRFNGVVSASRRNKREWKQ